MKIIYAILALIGSTPIGNAQVTLQSTDLNAIIGESINYEFCNWMNPGLAGAGITWDFSSLASNATISVSYTAPNTSFPATNITYDDPGIDGINFNDESTSGRYTHGTDGGGVITTYSNPKTLFEFPLSYGLSGSDTHLGGFDVGEIHIVSGETSYEVDGWGTVITPNGSYSDVLRVKLIQNSTDSIVNAAGPLISTIETYLWLKAGVHYPIVTLAVSSSNMFPDFTYGKYYSQSASIQESHASDFSFFPNPTNGELVLSLANNIEIKSVQITSLNGTLVKEINLASSNTINLTDLRAGVYFVTLLLTDGRKCTTKRIIKK